MVEYKNAYCHKNVQRETVLAKLPVECFIYEGFMETELLEHKSKVRDWVSAIGINF